MRKLSPAIAAALLCASIPVLAQEQDPAAAAAQMTRESLAKAYAEKARNDRIVEEQRAAEAAARARANQTNPNPSPSRGSRATPQ